MRLESYTATLHLLAHDTPSCGKLVAFPPSPDQANLTIQLGGRLAWSSPSGEEHDRPHMDP